MNDEQRMRRDAEWLQRNGGILTQALNSLIIGMRTDARNLESSSPGDMVPDETLKGMIENRTRRLAEGIRLLRELEAIQDQEEELPNRLTLEEEFCDTPQGSKMDTET